jgi:hypothetical protein
MVGFVREILCQNASPLHNDINPCRGEASRQIFIAKNQQPITGMQRRPGIVKPGFYEGEA